MSPLTHAHDESGDDARAQMPDLREGDPAREPLLHSVRHGRAGGGGPGRVGTGRSNAAVWAVGLAVAIGLTVILAYLILQPRVIQPQATVVQSSEPTVVVPQFTPAPMDDVVSRPLIALPSPPRPPVPEGPTKVTVDPLAPLDLPASSSPHRSLLGARKASAGMLVTTINLPAEEIVEDIVWSPAGDRFFALNADGVLSKVTADDFVEERRIDLGRRCGFMAPSADGLLVAMTDLQEVWVIDPLTLNVKGRVAAPGVKRVLSGPTLHFALCCADAQFGREGEVVYLDLTRLEPVYQFDVPTRFARLTPDGKYYFAEGGIEQLCCYYVKDGRLSTGPRTERIAQNGQNICLSPDGQLVCLPSGGGNYGSGYGTFIYAVDKLTVPKFALTTGPYPRLVAFDAVDQSIYAENSDYQLMLFSPTAIKRKQLSLIDEPGGHDEPRQFVPHPGGHRLLVLLAKRLLYVDLRPG